MTQPEAISAARFVADSRGFDWLEPAEAVGGASPNGSTTWVVCSTAGITGARVYVVLAGTGELLATGLIEP